MNVDLKKDFNDGTVYVIVDRLRLRFAPPEYHDPFASLEAAHDHMRQHVLPEYAADAKASAALNSLLEGIGARKLAAAIEDFQEIYLGGSTGVDGDDDEAGDEEE
ncbi:MAG: hypothetical protein KIS92_13860 [Planctomycetota bacterium]|nr:hypothetical protein [Planctomycetota bacterium]